MAAGRILGLGITGIGVARNAHARIAGQHALQAPSRLRGAVSHDHLACVLTVADADAAAVVKADPGGAAGRVDQRIQNGPKCEG